MTLALLLIDAVLLGASCLTFIPVLFLFLQIVVSAAIRRSVESPTTGSARTTGFTVLMPAHDEAAGIQEPIRSVLAQCGPLDRLVVIADNCSDATAAVARALGAEVIERRDPGRRGKGYALDFGIRWLDRQGAASVVVVIDADCSIAPLGLERLVRDCMASGRPVQGLYLMRAPPGARLGMRVAEFAWLVKNKLRPVGSAVWGWPCQLMGTGMAFPWHAIRQAELASGHLVEDMQLGLDLARLGSPPMFCRDAMVTSTFPVAREAVDSQRARWEHGHLSVIAGVVPRLLWRALVARDPLLLGMVLDVAVPPLAALILSLVGLMLLDVGWWWMSDHILPAGVTFASLLVMAVNILFAWWREGRRIIAIQELLGLPLYVLAKIPVYIRVFTKRQVEWVRTKRDDGRR